MQLPRIYKVILFVSIIAMIVFFGSRAASADRIDELEDAIADRAKKIETIERDIAAYQFELIGIGEEKRTLQSAINELDVSRNKLAAEIDLKQEEIDSTRFVIEKLNLEIIDKQRNITLNNQAIAQTIQDIHESDSQSLVESLLAFDSLSEFFEKRDTLERFQSVIGVDLQMLRNLKRELETTRQQLEKETVVLAVAQEELVDQKSGLDVAKGEKDRLLSITKNEESTYQALLAQKKAQRKAFEQEIAALEAELQIAIDPNSLPPTRPGILQWPVDNVIITQYFGNTPFASQNPQVYGGGGHNGIDLGVGSGSVVRSALAGTVDSWGNTDAIPGCFSYGKWILVRHNNGLATLYAHLSSINVTKGQSVGTGQLIGYSGNTGYSTGPHLHFTVYANQGVEVTDFTTSINCKAARIPIAPQEAYLNPLSYLPS